MRNSLWRGHIASPNTINNYIVSIRQLLLGAGCRTDKSKFDGCKFSWTSFGSKTSKTWTLTLYEGFSFKTNFSNILPSIFLKKLNRWNRQFRFYFNILNGCTPLIARLIPSLSHCLWALVTLSLYLVLIPLTLGLNLLIVWFGLIWFL